MDSACDYLPTGKNRFPCKTWMAISYECLDRNFINASRQDAAAARRCHLARSSASLLPKIATGRSIRSAKKLWEDFERVEVRSRIQNESEKPPETLPIRVSKNPHDLYKHKVASIKPYRILHGQLDSGGARHDLRRQLYAQVTYLSSAVRNCDGSASYRGMCKRLHGYRTDETNPSRLHWASSDDTIPLPRLLLPVTPGRNTKWYSWKVDLPKEVSPPRDQRETQAEKRFAVSAPASQSLDVLEQYAKSKRHVESDRGRRSRIAMSRDDRPGIHTSDRTQNKITNSDVNMFKLKEDEGIAGKSIFLTHVETRKTQCVVEVRDGTAMSCHGDQETEKKDIGKDDKVVPDGDDAAKKDETPDSLKDEIVPVVTANQVEPKGLPSPENRRPSQEPTDENRTPEDLKTSIDAKDGESCESILRNSRDINASDETQAKLQSPVTMETEDANEVEAATNGTPSTWSTSDNVGAENVGGNTGKDKFLGDARNLSKSPESLQANLKTLSISNDIDDNTDRPEDVTQEITDKN